ncbi:hypothetical protein HPB51_018970 [Rhipicephalus microplus]|uniref:THAP-type domain-containing protein n=1 Tax=Rhipicephalus microplus TaxID=6941 RepID=A0A9J6D6H1_RHIMP|nr:hypothetical protein HPB51_018970 [Rhipicephalus microplus]
MRVVDVIARNVGGRKVVVFLGRHRQVCGLQGPLRICLRRLVRTLDHKLCLSEVEMDSRCQVTAAALTVAVRSLFTSFLGITRWLQNGSLQLEEKNLKPTRASVLCSKHFRDRDYVRSPSLMQSMGLTFKSVRLNSDAVPSVFPHVRGPSPPPRLAFAKRRGAEARP